MQVIASHVNTDFDALASIVAAHKLYPNAQVVVANEQNNQVRQFLSIYRDVFPLVTPNTVEWEKVTELILVDVANLSRASVEEDKLDLDRLHITVYDHHPEQDTDVVRHQGQVERVGATVSLLVYEIKRKEIEINELEATLFGLGIYSDTQSFTNSGTTTQDYEAAAFLKDHQMNLSIIRRFNADVFQSREPEMIKELLQVATTHHYSGLEVIVCAKEYDDHYSGLATLARKLLQITHSDAVIIIARMRKNVYIVGRSITKRINLLPVIQAWKGGGHKQAASANVKNGNFKHILDEVTNDLPKMIKPALTARDIMTSPVKTVPPETTIEEARERMYRYGHAGFPVIQNGRLIGMITRRDIEKANHHGLGHAPVKGFMSTNIISITPEATAEEVQEKVIEHNIGRLPVVENNELIGIISRTNIIEVLHRETRAETSLKTNLAKELKMNVSEVSYRLLKDVSALATEKDVRAFLVGGMVRDLFLKRKNEDIDIVVEGNGMSFAKLLKEAYGGRVITHENFGTATWTTEEGIDIDIASSRLEHYAGPASLPDVEWSTFNEDLQRRDFTINAIALHLDEKNFGDILDPFRGQKDIQNKTIRTLHNLSFIEDPTRILRGIRFEARFNFSMDEQTEQLALQSMTKMRDLSPRRVMNEMESLLGEGKIVEKVGRLFELNYWQQYGIDASVKIVSQDHLKAFNKCLDAVEISREDKVFLQFIIPFYQGNKLVNARPFALTKEQGKLLKDIQHLLEEDLTEKSLGQLHLQLKDYGAVTLMFIGSQLADEQQTLLANYIRKRKQLPKWVTGKDLKTLGFKPGSYFADVLLKIDCDVLNDKITTEVEAKEAAIHYANEYIKESEGGHV